MRVATKLRAAFAVNFALLACVLVAGMHAVRGGVASNHELTAVASRLRESTNVQTAQLDDMGSSAGKFLVTRDRDYLNRVVDLARTFADKLNGFGALRLTEDERARLGDIAVRWRIVETTLRRATADSALSDATFAAIAGLEQELDLVRAETLRLADASRAAMEAELADSERAARETERIALGVAGAALLLSLVLSVLLVRGIVRPLGRLADGTRAIAAGRLGFRLPAGGRDELARVAASFNAMGERLEQVDLMKREFVSNVSHDLKTPLTSMQEAAQAVLDQLPGPLNDQQRRLLQLSLDSGQRLSSMIGKLLELSRLESGVGPEPRLELVDLARVARGAVQRAGVSSRSVLVVLDEPAESLHVRADADGIARVLDNLLENAIRFSPDGGAVRIHIGARGGAAVLTVADEGPGIPEPERERVFERFYQTADGRAARSHGVGLGLAICRHIVTSHHGSISIEGNTPGGTIVKVQLPLPTESRTSPPDDATRGKGFHDTRRGRRPLSAAAVALLLAITACATTRVPQHVAERDQMVRDIAALRARLDSARVDNDSLRLQAARLQFDLSDRDAELRALRLELERLKAIDLKPRPRLP